MWINRDFTSIINDKKVPENSIDKIDFTLQSEDLRTILCGVKCLQALRIPLPVNINTLVNK